MLEVWVESTIVQCRCINSKTPNKSRSKIAGKTTAEYCGFSNLWKTTTQPYQYSCIQLVARTICENQTRQLTPHQLLVRGQQGDTETEMGMTAWLLLFSIQVKLDVLAHILSPQKWPACWEKRTSLLQSQITNRPAKLTVIPPAGTSFTNRFYRECNSTQFTQFSRTPSIVYYIYSCNTLNCIYMHMHK